MNHNLTVLYRGVYFFIGEIFNFKIDSTDTTVGRIKATIILQDEKLSSTHCKFTIRGTNLFVTDVGSSNGTFLNGNKILPDTEVQIHFGDKMQIGSDVYVIREIFSKSIASPEVDITNQTTSAINYFKLSIYQKILYLFTIVLNFFFLYVWFFDMKNNTVPAELSFLIPIYKQYGMIGATCSFFIVTGSLFFNSYVSNKYFKNSIFFKIATFSGIIFFQIFAMCMISLSLDSREIPYYLYARTHILSNKTSIQSSADESSFYRSYSQILSTLSKAQQAVLSKDYENNVAIRNQKKLIFLKFNCEKGEIKDCQTLGLLKLRRGNFIEADILFKKACDGGEKKACESLTNLEKSKSALVSSMNTSYIKACEEGSPEACASEAELESKKGNIPAAKIFYKKACDAGLQRACE